MVKSIKKILFVNPAIENRSRICSSPLGLLSIASYMQANGYCVKIVDQTVKHENIKKHIRAFNPDIVAVAVISAHAGKAAIRVSKIAKAQNLPVVWGGQLISALPELGFQEGCVDYIVIGEGELTFLELIKTLSSGGTAEHIDGLAYLDHGLVRINKPRAFVDLSSLPMIDWSLVDAKQYLQPFFGCKKMLYLYASKGCPARCTFCFNPKFHNSTHRVRPIDMVVDEIAHLIETAGIDSVNFADEFWFPGAEQMQRFFSLIKSKNLNFVWGIQTRLGVYTQDDLRQMYDAGCRWILFGVESGCKERIKKINKGIDLDLARETFRVCKEIGITTQSAFIIGYPEETEEELKETVQFAVGLQANLCPFTILYLQPGSAIFEKALADKTVRMPSSLKDWSKVEMGELNAYNLSHVPDRDLKVVHFYTQWTAFFDKKSVTSDSYGIAKKMIADAAKRMIRFGPFGFITGTFLSLKQFFTVFWYAKAFPQIRKKYGLNNRR